MYDVKKHISETAHVGSMDELGDLSTLADPSVVESIVDQLGS